MAVRISGLVSGLDTDAIVQELVSAYSTKKDKYVKQQTKLEWTQDAWKSLNTKVYSFYTSKLSNMLFSTNYSKKTTSCSNESKAIVSASSNAVNGTQKLKINKVATTGYLTGGELQVNGKKASYTGSTKLSELGYTDSGNISVSVNGKTHTFSVTGDTTINNVISQLKTAGVNASFDETNQRFFISSKNSGEENDFALVGDANGIAAMKKMGIYTVSAADAEYYTSLAQTTDEEITNKALNEYLQQQVKAANAVLTEANTTYNKELTYLKNKEAKDEALQKNIEENDKAIEEKLGISKDAITRDADGNITNEEYLNLSDSDKAAVDKLLEKDATYAETLAEYEGYSADMDEDAIAARIEELETKISDNKAEMTANTKLAATTYTTEEFADNDDLKAMMGDYANAEGYQALVAKYEGIRTQAQNTVQDMYDADGNLKKVTDSSAVRIEGSDSEIELNGAIFTSNTNNYSINGLTITAMGVTEEDEEISITTETDIDGIYNMVKDFLSSYNELMKEMQTLYNADSSKGYEPLTDDEKDAMTDTEIEKWETKIKDSLLRRDQTLSGVISAMQTAMLKSYSVNGTTYSLASFGIATGSYFSTDANERGCLHIDGDADDDVTSGNTDKLRAAIASDPDTFVEAFSQIANGLYSTLSNKMARTSLSSAYTIYNDKYMKSQYEDLEDTIELWEQRIEDYEEKYYKQFSSMESALSELNSQSSSFASLLGS